ncbi:helix-turn-helix domain-containing protein [Bacillus thuringiensis]
MTADDILKAIREMDNSERLKLLDDLYDEYFDKNKWEERKWASLWKCISDSAKLIEKFPNGPKGKAQYSTAEAAEIFGVSEQTINAWVRDGRFIGLDKPEPNQPVKIKANAIWIARNGNLHYVSDFIKEAWEIERKKLTNTSDTSEEVNPLLKYIKDFENKYGGDFKSTLGKKEIQHMTAQEEYDASMWAYLLKEIDKNQ